MDRFGQQRCLEYLFCRARWFLRKGVVTLDGDVKGDAMILRKAKEFDWVAGAEPGTFMLCIGRCYTHICKNIFKFMEYTLAKVTCTCSSKSSTNHRYTHPIPRSVSGFFSRILSNCINHFVPPPGADSSQVEKRRKEAVENFIAELDVCHLHVQGKCHLCEHGPRSSDKVACCEAQRVAFDAYLSDIKEKADELFSPAGKVHIQHCESNNSIVARFRPKGDMSISPFANFLAETLAFLNIMELQMGAHGHRFSSLVRISQCVKQHFGFTFNVDYVSEDLYLQKRINMKCFRATPMFRKKEAERKARKREKKKSKNQEKKEWIGFVSEWGVINRGFKFRCCCFGYE